ncbi:MAG: ATP-binding protein [Bdellovibrionales bacterium]|nr:ATP-binding protein [Bdellovibrionales bacterium]
MYSRSLKLDELVAKTNYFLFGPRSTGKSSLIKAQLPRAQVIDLLEDSTYEQLLRRPESLSEMFQDPKEIVVIDEIQKLPKLMDEVHRLIEKRKIRFLLTGSSARKLRRQGGNMLGGRAREALLFPLTWYELDKHFNLVKYLNYGGLPIIYDSAEPIEDLKAYCKNYLNEEIKIEAAVRNYDRFVRFLETMALNNGQEINYEGLSSDCGVPARTLEGHIEVLKDTLIGFELMPLTKTIKRKAISRSKFYFFDTGISNFLGQKLPLNEGAKDLGISFEQFIINEVKAYLSYSRKNHSLCYWRSRTHEVDLIVGKSLAIEIKLSQNFKPEFFNGLRALREENLIESYLVIGRFPREGSLDGIRYMGYETFLKQLWTHQFNL